VLTPTDRAIRPGGPGPALAALRGILGGGIGLYALPAAILLAVVMGQRSSFGLFLSPINSSTGIGLASLSLAVAASQLAWGLAQPVCGILADRYGPARVIGAGVVLFALGNVATVMADSGTSLLLVLTIGGAVGAAAGGAPLLLGAVGQRVCPTRRGMATGVVSAGGSAGQLTIAPLTQGTIAAAGWVNAMLLLALLSLATMPLARAFRRKHGGADRVESVERIADARPAALPAATRTASAKAALRDPAYWLVTFGFFVCGFHVSFLTTHMPGVIESCGMPAALAGAWLAIVGACNIVGSIVSGMLTQHRSMRRMLMILYAGRAAGVAAFVLAPKTPTVMLLFAVWMGATYMATLPPTSGLIARFYGAGNLARLLGLTMLFHQVGSFLGVWLGGVAFELSGHYDWLWAADIGLALLAVLAHAPLRDVEPDSAVSVAVPGRSAPIVTAAALAPSGSRSAG